MSQALNDMGVIGTFAASISSSLTSLGLQPIALCALLNVAYYYVHYLFASQTAHVGALYTAFMVSAGLHMAAVIRFEQCAHRIDNVCGEGRGA